MNEHVSDKTHAFRPPLIDGPKLFINLGPKLSKALERERPRIVNNFAKRVSRYELPPHPDYDGHLKSFEWLISLECRTILRP
jgi:hypothetical protein